LTQLQENFAFCKVWDKDYMLAVLRHEMLRRGLPLLSLPPENVSASELL
jgi:hypothetical protein